MSTHWRSRARWRCVFCGQPAREGSLTCGRPTCSELRAREMLASAQDQPQPSPQDQTEPAEPERDR